MENGYCSNAVPVFHVVRNVAQRYFPRHGESACKEALPCVAALPSYVSFFVKCRSQIYRPRTAVFCGPDCKAYSNPPIV